MPYISDAIFDPECKEGDEIESPVATYNRDRAFYF